MALTSGIKLAPLMVDIKADTKGFKGDMVKASEIGVTETKRISKSLAGVTKIGEGLGKVGSSLTKFVSLPLAGVALAATKMSLSFDTAMAKVGTIADTSQVPMKDMEKAILKLSRQTGISANDIADNVYNAISAGQKTGDAVNFVSNATKLAKAGFAESADTLDLLTTIMNSYGLEAKEVTKVSDILINTQNLGKTTVAELSSAMGKVIPTAKSVGVGIEQVSSGYAIMTAKGVKAAETTTYMNSMFNELGKSGTVASDTVKKLSGKSFQQLIKEGKTVGDVLAILDNGAKNSNKSLADMFGSAEAGKAAMLLVENGGKDFNKMLQSMNDSTGATEEAFKKMSSTSEDKLKVALNKLKVSGIELGKKLLPIAQKGIEGLTKLADKLGNLSGEQQRNILKWGGIALAAGPVFKLLGGGIKVFTTTTSAIGGISKALGAVKAAKAVSALGSVSTAAATATGVAGTATMAGTGVLGLASSLGGMALAAAPFVAVGAAVVGTGLIINKAMSKDYIKPVDLFADTVGVTSKVVTDKYGLISKTITTNATKITDATKQNVKSYLDMDKSITQSLFNFGVHHTRITKDIAKDMTSTVDTMGETIKEGQQKKYEELNKDYVKFFSENSILTNKEEQKILERMGKQNIAEQKSTDNKVTEIARIIKSARDMERELSQAESDRINSLQLEMKDSAITALSQTEAEAAVIKQRIKDYDGRISVEMARDSVQQANKARDGEIKAAEDKYNNVIIQASRLKKAGLITDEEYAKMVKTANEAKKDQVEAAEKGCNEIKDAIEKGSPGIWESVNKQTGKIYEGWNKLWGGIKKFWGDIWSWGDSAEKTVGRQADKTKYVSEKTRHGSHYNGLNYVPFDGYTATLHKGERIVPASENRGSKQGITQNLTINAPKALNPSEIARQNKYALQQLALQL